MRLATMLLGMLLAGTRCFAAQVTFDAEQNRWVIDNEWLRAVFQLTPDGVFVTREITDLTTKDQWVASDDRPSAMVRLEAGGEVFDAQRQYTLLDQFSQKTTPSGVRQFIRLQDRKVAAEITLIFEMYDNQPVLRYGLRYRNLSASTVYVTSSNLLPWSFADMGKQYRAIRVNQWSVGSRPEDFQSFQAWLDTAGAPFGVNSGAHGEQCGWLAVRDSDNRGLFAGWEFDGRSEAAVRHVAEDGDLEFSATILDLHHPLAASAEFESPWAFVGLFHGNFDEAGYRTQRFVEAVLAQPIPDARAFPYVSWDSWAYEDQIDDDTLRRNADAAAAMGVELFVVDLGWARSIGDWYENRDKFPGGLAAVSQYVHSLGMKFGLHFALTEADRNSPVLQQHPIGLRPKVTITTGPSRCAFPTGPPGTGWSSRASV